MQHIFETNENNEKILIYLSIKSEMSFLKGKKPHGAQSRGFEAKIHYVSILFFLITSSHRYANVILAVKRGSI